MNKSEECIICGASLEYLDNPIEMECAICHRKFTNNVRCEQGHYVCDECHTTGVDSIVGICMKETSSNPIDIIEKMMSLPTCHMHGPKHHIMVGASLITAYKNAGGNVDLEWSLSEIIRRGKQVPGGACGNWGACGAGISTGMFISIITKSNPLAGESWGLSNLMTSRALARIAETGGPRCCKRDSYNAILAAIEFVDEKFSIKMANTTKPTCSRSAMNNHCLKSKCPFNTPVFTIPTL